MWWSLRITLFDGNLERCSATIAYVDARQSGSMLGFLVHTWNFLHFCPEPWSRPSSLRLLFRAGSFAVGFRLSSGDFGFDVFLLGLVKYILIGRDFWFLNIFCKVKTFVNSSV